MKKENKEKTSKSNLFEINVEIKTEFGSFDTIFNYSEGYEAFCVDLQNYTTNEKGSVDIDSWSIYLEYAQDAYKKLIPIILEDAIKQAWLEAKVKTFLLLNDEAFFQTQTVKEEGKDVKKIYPVQLPKFSSEFINDFKKNVIKEATQASRNRIDRGIGGSRFKIGGNNFAALDDYYKRFHLQAKSILCFYKWKKELWENQSHSNTSDKKWTKHFCNSVFKGNSREDAKILQKLIVDAQNTSEKTKLLKVKDSLWHLLNIESNERKLWKKTFSDLIEETYLFSEFQPSILAQHLLAIFFNVKVSGIRKNLKDLSKIKKSILNGYD